MNKKIMIGLVVFIFIIGGISYFLINNKTKGNKEQTNNNETEINQDLDNNENNKLSDGKVLVVYFSAQNHTRQVAEQIAKNLNADLFEIVPTERYTEDDLDWTDEKSRVSKEHEDETLRNIKLETTEVKNWDSYDTVLIGYPIWWAVAAWPVNTFVSSNDFSGKTIIPFCTSSSSGIGESGKLLEDLAGSGTWLEGHRFTSNEDSTEIKK